MSRLLKPYHFFIFARLNELFAVVGSRTLQIHKDYKLNIAYDGDVNKNLTFQLKAVDGGEELPKKEITLTKNSQNTIVTLNVSTYLCSCFYVFTNINNFSFL
jgi:hypothetical protein